MRSLSPWLTWWVTSRRPAGVSGSGLASLSDLILESDPFHSRLPAPPCDSTPPLPLPELGPSPSVPGRLARGSGCRLPVTHATQNVTLFHGMRGLREERDSAPTTLVSHIPPRAWHILGPSPSWPNDWWLQAARAKARGVWTRRWKSLPAPETFFRAPEHVTGHCRALPSRGPQTSSTQGLSSSLRVRGRDSSVESWGGSQEEGEAGAEQGRASVGLDLQPDLTGTWSTAVAPHGGNRGSRRAPRSLSHCVGVPRVLLARKWSPPR